MFSEYYAKISMLYVEDDEEIREELESYFSIRVKDLFVAKNGQEGLELYLKYKPDIIITDINMPIMDGIEMSKQIRKMDRSIPIILITAFSDMKYMRDAISIGVSNYLLKPINLAELEQYVVSNIKSVLFEREKERHNKILQKIMDSDTDMLVVSDSIKIIYTNQAFKLFFNRTNDSNEFQFDNLCGKFLAKDGFLHRGVLKEKENFRELLLRTQESNRIVTLFDDKSGEQKAFLIKISLVEDDLYIFHFVDITQMLDEKKSLETKAYFDELTKIFNRSKLNELSMHEIERSKRYGDPLSLIIFDIDHFKLVNDTYGHLVGDEVLKMLAKSVGMGIRKTDIFARWGGEEFVLLLPETSIEQAEIVAQQLRKRVEELKYDDIGTVTCSFGVSAFSPNDTLESLIEKADIALFQAKNSGRNRVEVNRD